MRKNLSQEDVVDTILLHWPQLDRETVDSYYTIITRELANIVYNTPHGVYLPYIGVLYRDKITPKKPRLSEDSDETSERFKIKLSAKPYTEAKYKGC